MADQIEADEKDGSGQELRGKLMARLAMAASLVAVLLGVLAFFDYLATEPEEPEDEIFTKPVPVAPKKTVSQPVTPVDTSADPVVSPAPEHGGGALLSEPPPPPKVAALPSESTETPVKPLPAPTGKKLIPPSATAPSVLQKPIPETTSAPNGIVEPSREPSPTAVAPVRPSARRVEDGKASTPTPPRLFSGFLLQAGVFANVQGAEELHARLALSGVPSTLETRVQVGPFRTRQEAEAAQAKLKALGIETLLVPPKGKN